MKNVGLYLHSIIAAFSHLRLSAIYESEIISLSHINYEQNVLITLRQQFVRPNMFNEIWQ